MITEEMLINRVKNTVGYSESENREEFLKGAKVALYGLMFDYNKDIEGLTLSNTHLQASVKFLEEELSTIANIITKYSD